jgi:hypothetical protein
MMLVVTSKGRGQLDQTDTSLSSTAPKVETPTDSAIDEDGRRHMRPSCHPNLRIRITTFHTGNAELVNGGNRGPQ